MTRSKAILSVLVLVSLVGDVWLAMAGVGLTRRVGPRTIQPAMGRAYVVPVGLRWPFRAVSDSNEHPRRSRLLVLENGVVLGPGHALHDAIQQAGAGRFSHWGTVVYFSTSDGTDPRTNGRVYELRFVAILDRRLAVALLVLGAGVLAVCLATGRVAPGVRAAGDGLPLRRVARFLAWLLPRVAVAVASVALVLVVVEAVSRRSRPFAAATWPSIFDARVGFRFEPKSVVQWTNQVDFWTETRANSLGFLDREPPSARPANGCRVLVIGDSVVEAAQVPIEKKFHVIFERLAREQLHREFQTIALGYSGTGQTLSRCN